MQRFDFGRARIAIGHVATPILPLFAAGQAVEGRAAAPAAPAPEQSKK